MKGTSVSKRIQSGNERESFVNIWWTRVLVMVLNYPEMGKRREEWP